MEDHGIHWNSDKRPAHVSYTHAQVPTLFTLAKRAGFSTALIAGKAKFIALAQPDSLDFSFIPEGTGGDHETTEEAMRIMHEHAPAVVRIGFPVGPPVRSSEA